MICPVRLHWRNDDYHDGEDFIALKGLTEPDLLALDLDGHGGLYVVAFVDDYAHRQFRFSRCGPCVGCEPGSTAQQFAYRSFTAKMVDWWVREASTGCLSRWRATAAVELVRNHAQGVCDFLRSGAVFPQFADRPGEYPDVLSGLFGAPLLVGIDGGVSLQLWLKADDFGVTHRFALPRLFAEGYSIADAGQATAGPGHSRSGF
jgi:hypothetical protein